MAPNLQLGRRVKLRDLHYFLAVVQTGSMAKAANLLSVSQPVVSKVIANLEYLIGQPLLDRSPRGVEPTIYGQRLLASSFVIFDELRQGIAEVGQLRGETVGELSVGSNEASTLGIVPAAIGQVQADHPRLSIQVVLVNTPEEQHHELRHRTVELCIGRVETYAPDADFETEILFQERYVVVSGPNSRWSRRSSVDLSELVHERWVLPPSRYLSGRQVMEIFRRRNLPAPVGHVRTPSIQLVQRLLEQDRFLALLPTTVLPAMAPYAVSAILPVPLPDLVLPMGIVTLRGRKLGPAAKAFIAAARGVARSIQEAGAELPGA